MSDKVLISKSLLEGLADVARTKAGTTIKYSIPAMQEIFSNLKNSYRVQTKTVTPTKTIQQVSPDSMYDGLSRVTVNPIPVAYIIPSGTVDIVENGTYDVKQYASVNVVIPDTPTAPEWDGTILLEGESE